MIPKLEDIDHIHVYVSQLATAAQWYREVLGFQYERSHLEQPDFNGPLMLSNKNGEIHLALFRKQDATGDSALAFRATADEFMGWIDHLESKGLTLRLSDHESSYSLYFKDPDGNLHEITTPEHGAVRTALS